MGTPALLASLLLGATLGAAQDEGAPAERPPIARHLTDLVGLDSPMGVAVTDERTIFVAEGVTGRIVRIDADETRHVVVAGLQGARDL